MRVQKGLFITLEGGEGSGKSTQCRLLCKYLQSRGHRVVCTHEPGGTRLGQRIRKLLLRTTLTINPQSETMLYMASRAQLVQEVLLPALKQGKTVVSDRWLDATLAYQGHGLGVDQSWIRRIAAGCTAGLEPHLTLFLDLPIHKGLKRARARGKLDRIEKRKAAFHQRVLCGYRKLAKRNKRIQRIEVTTIQATRARIERALDRVI